MRIYSNVKLTLFLLFSVLLQTTTAFAQTSNPIVRVPGHPPVLLAGLEGAVPAGSTIEFGSIISSPTESDYIGQINLSMSLSGENLETLNDEMSFELNPPRLVIAEYFGTLELEVPSAAGSEFTLHTLTTYDRYSCYPWGCIHNGGPSQSTTFFLQVVEGVEPMTSLMQELGTCFGDYRRDGVVNMADLMRAFQLYNQLGYDAILGIISNWGACE